MRQFSGAHLAALAVTLLASGLSVWAARRDPRRWTNPIAWTLALLIFAAWAGEYLADVLLGTWTTRYDLPLQLTDAVSLVCILALLTRRMLWVELAYFWALTATLQAAVTPDLSRTFPSVYYLTYFTYHGGAIAGSCFLVFGCRLYPRPGAVARVYAATAAVALVAGLGDIITGGNYMYLREKPVHDSLLNVMGPWPVYIISTAILGLALMILVKLITDWIRRRDIGGDVTVRAAPVGASGGDGPHGLL